MSDKTTNISRWIKEREKLTAVALQSKLAGPAVSSASVRLTDPAPWRGRDSASPVRLTGSPRLVGAEPGAPAGLYGCTAGR